MEVAIKVQFRRARQRGTREVGVRCPCFCLRWCLSGLSCLSYCLSVCCLSCLRVSRQGQGQQRGKGKGQNHWPWGRGKG
jgi:hypothetical protein